LYHNYLRRSRGRWLRRWLLIVRLIPKITVFIPVRSAIREPDGSVSTVMMAARTQREKAIRRAPPGAVAWHTASRAGNSDAVRSSALRSSALRSATWCLGGQKGGTQNQDRQNQ